MNRTDLRGARPRRLDRVVITGGAGFLGSHLCTELVARGTHVVCLDNFVTGSPANVAHLEGSDLFDLRECDVTELVTVTGNVDAVLHFASPASPIDYLQLPIETLKVGSIGTLHALGLARVKGARFILASTSEVYGVPLVHPQPEDYWGNVNPVGPRGVYDEAKRFGEALTTAYRTSRGVDTGIIRIFSTYGPRMRAHDGRAISTFISQALAGEPVTIAGDGKQTRSVCYVGDLVDGVLAMAQSTLAGPINIGSSRELTVRQIAADIVAATGSHSKLHFVGRPIDDPQVRPRHHARAVRTRMGGVRAVGKGAHRDRRVVRRHTATACLSRPA